MNYPEQQARKALLKKLINERNKQLSFFEKSLSHAKKHYVNDPEISILSEIVKTTKKEIKMLAEIAKENKKIFQRKVSLFRSMAGKQIFGDCYFTNCVSSQFILQKNSQ